MVQISLQNSGGKVVSSGGFHGTPLGTNGNESTLITFKVLTTWEEFGQGQQI